MERIHKLTKEFMVTAGQTVRETPSVPTVDEMKLRLSLEFEELFEKAEAMGLASSFEAIVYESFWKKLDEYNKKCYGHSSAEYDEKNHKFLDSNIVNLVEVFDAALDQRVVASGTDLAFGFQHIIPAGDTEVHRSNMSKFDNTVSDASKSIDKYVKDGIGVVTEKVGDKHVTRRASDNKVLKSHQYSPADLVHIVLNGSFGHDDQEKPVLSLQEQPISNDLEDSPE